MLIFAIIILGGEIAMIGIILRNIRKLRGLTQVEMSKKLILADNTISNYETGYSTPNFDTIKKFLDVCNFEMQFIDKEKNKIYSLEELSREMDF